MLKEFVITLLLVNLLKANFDDFSCESVSKCTQKSDSFFEKSNNAVIAKCHDTQMCIESRSKMVLNDTSRFYLETQAVFNMYENTSFAMTGESMSSIGIHGEMLLQPNSTIQLSAMSYVITYQGGRLKLDEDSELIVTSQSSIELFQAGKRNEKQEFILKAGSNVFINDASNFHLISGQFILHNDSRLKLYSKSTLIVDGFVEIQDQGQIEISKLGELVVGYWKIYGDGTKNGDADSTLIIRKSVQLLVGERQSLLVSKKAHCLLKKSLSLEEHIKLDSSTQNENFACFAVRTDLMAAIDTV